jgi:hypothetical protein
MAHLPRFGPVLATTGPIPIDGAGVTIEPKRRFSAQFGRVSGTGFVVAGAVSPDSWPGIMECNEEAAPPSAAPEAHGRGGPERKKHAKDSIRTSKPLHRVHRCLIGVNDGHGSHLGVPG